MSQTTRKLAAIVVADVVGYSALMGADEEGTLAALNRHRCELIDPEIAAHGGRIVKTMGDGLLVEFPSVVEAVQCCGRRPGRHGGAQPPCAGGAAHFVPPRHQSWRRHRRGRRHPWRWGQYRRPARRPVRPGRHLPFGRCPASGPQPGRFQVRRPGGGDAQETLPIRCMSIASSSTISRRRRPCRARPHLRARPLPCCRSTT